MRNWWIRFGCFLTGYNYNIIRNSSEVAAKAVKRYTAAMLIVCILWAFIGYTFSQRYLEASLIGSIAGGALAVIIIVQIERQIILSMNPNRGLFIFRGFLALMMSLIGAVIIDQIILKQDIELEKIQYISKKVDDLLPSKTNELKNQIGALDSTIKNKETERQTLIEDVSNKPLIKNVSSQTQQVPIVTTKPDSSGVMITSTVLKPSTTILISNSANPKQALIAPLDTVIAEMRNQKAEKDNALLNVRPQLEKEIKNKTGFLDELKVMYSLISNSAVALGFWLLWVFFLLFIEMLVLFSKIGDKADDYTKTVLNQMSLHMRKLDVLEKIANGN
jgi:hypothetical protein